MHGLRTVGMMVLLFGACAFVAAGVVETMESHVGKQGPALRPGITPSALGWGPDEQPYPGRFVVCPRDGSELVWVPPGGFPMGTTPERVAELLQRWPETIRDLGRCLVDAETPQRQVSMVGFWMGRHEVTNAQYRAFCEATGRQFPSASDQPDDHPVAWLAWEDAAAYAEHQGLGLPTEAQWEYAARGPDGPVYPWGDDWDPARLCWDDNPGPDHRTFAVGSFPDGVSWCGALDMAGNVAEWCADWYDPDYYKTAPTDTPPGPAEAVTYTFSLDGRLFEIEGSRVLRGGSWNNSDLPDRFRCAARDTNPYPSERYETDGFRICTMP